MVISRRLNTFVLPPAASRLPRDAVMVVERRQLDETQTTDLLRVLAADVTDARHAQLVGLRDEMLQQQQR